MLIRSVSIFFPDTFDNFFGRFPGTNGVTLPRASNPVRSDFNHNAAATGAAVDSGKMDGFPVRSMVQYTQADIPIYQTAPENPSLQR